MNPDVPPIVPSPTPRTNVRRIKRIAPLKLGAMLGVIYAAISIVFVPFLLLAFIGAGTAAHASDAPQVPFMFGMGAAFVVALPILYGIMGFIGGVVMAFIYNLAAKWIGGVEVEVE